MIKPQVQMWFSVQDTHRIVFEEYNTDNDNNSNNDNNKYIFRELNPSVRNQPEVQSAVHVQSKLSKLHIQLKPSKQRN